MITQEILFIIDENKQLLFDGKIFKNKPSKKVKEYFSGATIPLPLIRTHGFKAPKTNTEEKTEIQAEMKMFDETGLDPDIDYKIVPLTIPLENNDNNYIETYAVEVSKIEELFSSIAKKNSQIDAIFPPSITYLSLYTFELLEKKSDLFIYFGDDISYAVIFKNGQYISTRTIPSLNELADKIGLKLDELKKHLSQKGILANKYITKEPEKKVEETNVQDSSDIYNAESLMAMPKDDTIKGTNQLDPIQKGLLERTTVELSKLCDKIAHAIGHKRGVFKLETIDRIYLDFEGSDIPGFLDIFNNIGFEDSSKEILNIFEDVEVGLKHYAVNALYALGAAQEKHKIVNQTIFERKPAFLKTNVGQFSIVLLSSIIFSSIYPIYAYLELEDLIKQENILKNDVAKMEKATKKLTKALNSQRVIRNKLRDTNKKINSDIRSYDYMLNHLQKFDIEAISRQKMIKDINILMSKYKLSSRSLIFREPSNVIVQIISTYDERDNIAKFIKDLLLLNYSKVRTKEVIKNKHYYESVVEIVL